jgi:nitrogen fixation NifU-like protein
MADLRELYQEVILDHTKNPRNYGSLEDSSHQAAGHNPICGDHLVVYVRVEDDLVADVGFEGNGCAISTASASLMTQSIKGKPIADAEALFSSFHEAVTSPVDAELDGEALGKLVVLAGVREFPMRVKCASLAWHTLRAALAGQGETTTE